MQKQTKYYSISEVAKMLQKTRQWIWVLIISGRLKAEKVGQQYIVSKEELINYTKNKEK